MYSGWNFKTTEYATLNFKETLDRSFPVMSRKVNKANVKGILTCSRYYVIRAERDFFTAAEPKPIQI